VAAIFELDKRECLMSLLECGYHVVRQNKRWRYKVIAHCTGGTIFGIISIEEVVMSHGTWIQFRDPVDSYISTGSGLGESSLASVLFQHQSTLRWRRQYVSFCWKFCWISSCNPVSHCEFVCMYSRSWVTGKRFWLEGIGVCIRSCSQWRPQVGTVVLPNL
jgi:hypothetical protein